MSGKPKRTRRRWSNDFKHRVVAEASQPGMSMAAVAQRYDLTNTLLLNWKRRFGVDRAFLPVEVVLEPSAPSVKSMDLESKIEIQLCNGHRVSVSGSFDPDAVARLLRGLSR